MDSLLTPAATLRDSMRDMKMDPVLRTGIPVSKITSKGVIKKRILTISADNMVLFITHERINLRGAGGADSDIASSLRVPLFTLSKGFSWSSSKSVTTRYIRYVDASDIDGWQRGVLGTLKFENAIARNTKLDWNQLVQKTITIFHHGLETLDFIIENDNHRDALVKAIEQIHTRYHAEEQVIANDALLLRHVWYDIDTDKDSKLSEKEFLRLCARINLQSNDIKNKFRGFLREHDIRREKLVYGECKALLQSIKSEMTTSLTEEVFSKIFGDDYKKGISAEDFLQKFMKDTQGDAKATLEDAKKLISTLQCIDLDTVKMKTATSDMLVDFDSLNEHLLSKSNDAYSPSTRQESTKLDKPISHYWINTSHNTYLTGTKCN